MSGGADDGYSWGETDHVPDARKMVCAACGLPWVNHLGVQGTCARVQELEQALAWITTRPETGMGASQMRQRALEVLG